MPRAFWRRRGKGQFGTNVLSLTHLGNAWQEQSIQYSGLLSVTSLHGCHVCAHEQFHELQSCGVLSVCAEADCFILLGPFISAPAW